jgi:Domain of unknown function (DUF4360)
MKSAKKLVNTLLIGSALMTVISPAFAAEKVEIQGATYGGSGCPTDSAKVNVSPDGQELTILFDKFIAQGSNPADSRKSCNLSIPVKVPQGFQISLYEADYRGYVAPATTGKLRAEHFFAGQKGPVFERIFQGDKDYNVRQAFETAADVWSACGDSLNMRVNASMVASGKGTATVDSFDLAHRGLVYHVKYRACQAKG